MNLFSFKVIPLNSDFSWWKVKDEYLVRFDGVNWTCTCLGETFKIGGKKQKHCKHIKECFRRYKFLKGCECEK
jgi:hypothetical protein